MFLNMFKGFLFLIVYRGATKPNRMWFINNGQIKRWWDPD